MPRAATGDFYCEKRETDEFVLAGMTLSYKLSCTALRAAAGRRYATRAGHAMSAWSTLTPEERLSRSRERMVSSEEHDVSTGGGAGSAAAVLNRIDAKDAAELEAAP